MEERGLDDLKRAKDCRFLKHDLVLHLRDLPLRDDVYRREFAALSQEYLAGIDPMAYEAVHPSVAICAYLLRQGDGERLIPALGTLVHRDKISSPLAQQDGRVYWTDAAGHLDEPLRRRVLDVTELDYHHKQLEQISLRNELTGFAATGNTVRGVAEGCVRAGQSL